MRGIEAAFALAKNRFRVALITLNKNKLAMLPCNPSIGGPAKGIITREIDALGGMQGYFADQAMIQIKMLNTSKGPAVRALRAQVDKDKYSAIVRAAVCANRFITLIEAVVEELVVVNQTVVGVRLADQRVLDARVVIVTTGTYMSAKILRGHDVTTGGPDGEPTSTTISASLRRLGLQLIRLKTGTPARIWADSIDWTQLEEEVLPVEKLNFSHRSGVDLTSQVHCWLTYTNAQTHAVILANLDKSAMYSGLIEGPGPRYCPSIEDKVVRFAHKDRHQVFLEPETARQDVYYINGLSTSMPAAVQEQFLRTIPALKACRIQKYGYAIEYDAIASGQIHKSLEAKAIQNLFFAGQINGTSGYEEAGGQGVVAGINAALKLQGRPALDLKRYDSYIGVLIDDLVLKGTKEPYRMLTSRAEFRLLLRNDNADIRLAKYARYANMITAAEYDAIVAKYELIAAKIAELQQVYLSANDPLAQKYQVWNGQSWAKLLARPDVDPDDFIADFPYKYELMIQIRLEGYITKQQSMATKLAKLEGVPIPKNIDYHQVYNLALEARDKLSQIQPATIGEAARISGINPADIEMILFHINVRMK